MPMWGVVKHGNQTSEAFRDFCGSRRASDLSPGVHGVAPMHPPRWPKPRVVAVVGAPSVCHDLMGSCESQMALICRGQSTQGLQAGPGLENSILG